MVSVDAQTTPTGKVTNFFQQGSRAAPKRTAIETAGIQTLPSSLIHSSREFLCRLVFCCGVPFCRLYRITFFPILQIETRVSQIFRSDLAEISAGRDFAS